MQVKENTDGQSAAVKRTPGNSGNDRDASLIAWLEISAI